MAVLVVVEDFRSAGLLWEKWTWWDLKPHTSSDGRSSSWGGGGGGHDANAHVRALSEEGGCVSSTATPSRPGNYPVSYYPIRRWRNP